MKKAATLLRSVPPGGAGRVSVARAFVSAALSAALDDPAYRSPDHHVGRWGISWMHDWEQAMGRPRSGSPHPPSWVSAAYEKMRP